LATVWLGLPTDFLIGTDGWVLALKYGTDAYDQWSVDELLAIARKHAPAKRGPGLNLGRGALTPKGGRR
jgi:hypothetical protein